MCKELGIIIMTSIDTDQNTHSPAGGTAGGKVMEYLGGGHIGLMCQSLALLPVLTVLCAEGM